MNKNQNYNQNIGRNDIFYRPPYTMNGTDDQCPGTAVCQQPRKGTQIVLTWCLTLQVKRKSSV